MMILITGGAACGKSYMAEQLVMHFPGKRYYLATMRPWGADGQAKVVKHRAMRAGKHFHTIECYGNLASVAIEDTHAVVLLECVTNLLADELYDENEYQCSCEQARANVLLGIQTLKSQCETLIMITNDVGSDGMLYAHETADYVRLLGEINCKLAAQSDVVIDMSCGIPAVIKGTCPQGVLG